MRLHGLERILFSGVLVLCASAACVDGDPEGELPELDLADSVLVIPEAGDAAEVDVPVGESRTAVLNPTEGHDVTGIVTVVETGDGVRVVAEISGLTEGEHAFHVHETGDCSAPDASSAGDHWAPEGSAHGGPDEEPPAAHVGDMGNLTADASGRASFERTFDDMTLEGPRGIAGRSIIVHAAADDLETQPSGESGDRVACGVISETI